MTIGTDITPLRAEASQRPPRAQSAPSPAADPTSPYLGLRSFSEADRKLFHGREAETDELFHLVQRETLSVVFGVSGLGKSSLLRAGLFPRLRVANLFPIAIRLTFGADDLVAQIRATIATEIIGHGVEATPPAKDMTLWEYFHRTPFWNARNRPLVPVIVLDQFEELFTLGHSATGRMALLVELGDMIENRIPEAVRAARDADALPPAFQVPKAKVILSLREDYLARLEDLCPAIPSIARGRFRLRPMNGAQAVRAVRHERTVHLVDVAVAERIVRFVAGARAEGLADTALDALPVEPALLSLVCRQLDEVRRAHNVPTISADLLTGETGRILADFYEGAVHGLDPQVVAALEDHLITPDGHRTIVAMSSLAPVDGLAAAVSTLVDRRILRIEQLYGRDHVEVIHDVLTRVIVPRRDDRRDRAARRRRTRWLFAAVIAVSAVTALMIGAVLYLGARHQLEEDRRRAAEAAARSLAAEAAAVLSHGESWSAIRLIDVAYGMVAEHVPSEQIPPEIGLIAGRFTALKPLLAKLEQPSSRITAMVFSRDGALLLAGHEDGSVSIWSTRDWTRTQLQPASGAEGSAVPGDPGHLSAGSTTEPLQRDAQQPVRALAVSRDGRFVAVGAGGETAIWNTREHTRKGTISATQTDVRLTDDGAVVQLINRGEFGLRESRVASDQLYLYQGGQYRQWHPPSISPSCKVTMRSSPGGYGSKDLALLAISGDNSTLALYQSGSQALARMEHSRGALSLFALPVTPQQDRTAPVLQTTRCERGERFRYEDLLINTDGTAIGFHSGLSCIDDEACDRVVIRSRNAPGEPLPEPRVGTQASFREGNPLAFDGRQPDIVLRESAFERVITSLDARMQRAVPSPCTPNQSDLSDGRLVTMGSCGQFIVVPHEGAAIVGELPVTQGSLITVSAAAQLAAIATSDGALRVWRLEAPGRHLAQGGPTSLTAPLSWKQAFDAATKPDPLPLVVTADGRRVIAATPAADHAPAGVSNATANAIAMFDVSATEVKPVRTIAVDPSGAPDPPGADHLELSPDGQHILGVGRNGRVALWELEGRRVLGLDDRASGRVHHATYSLDGALLATLAVHRTCLWDSANGHLLGCASIGADGNLVFDREHRAIVADEDGTVKRWAPSSAPSLIGRSNAGARLAVDRDRHWLAAAERGALRVWDLQHCTAAGCPEVAYVQDDRGFEQARFVLVGDEAFVLGVGKAARAHVIDLGRPAVDHVLSLAGAGVQDVDVSPAGRGLLCEGNRVEEWDIVHLRLTGILTLSNRRDATLCQARYAGDGRVITRDADGTLAIWPPAALSYGLAPSWSVCMQSGSWSSCDHASVSSVNYIGGGGMISYDGDLTRIIDSTSGDLIAAARGVTVPAVTAEGAMIVSGDGQLQKITSAGEIKALGRATGKRPRMLAIDATSGEVLWIDADRQYRFVDRAGQPRGPERALVTSLPSDALQALRYAPSGQWMLGARSNGTLTRFDINGQNPDSEPFTGGASWIVPALHGDGLLAVGDDAVAAWTDKGPPKILHVPGGIIGGAAIWDMATGTIVLGLEGGLAAFDLASGQQQWRNSEPFPRSQIAWVDVGTHASRPAILASNGLAWNVFHSGDVLAQRAAPAQTMRVTPTTAGWSIEPDRLLTLDANGNVTLWQTRGATVLSVLRSAVVKRGSADLARMQRRPDGSFAAAGKSGASLLRIVGDRVSTEAELLCPGLRTSPGRNGSPPAPVRPGYTIAISPEGRWVAAAFEQEIADASSSRTHHGICMWDTSASSRQPVHVWDLGTSQVAELSFSHDGDRLLARMSEGLARLWSAPSGPETTTFGHEDIVTAVYARGRPYIATEDHAGNVRVYDARTGAPIGRLGKPLAAGSRVTVAVDAASGRLAMLDGQGDIAVIDLASGAHLHDWTSHIARRAISIAPISGVVAAASDDGVLVWNPTAIDVPVPLDAPNVIAMRFSPDGSWLATVGQGPNNGSFHTGLLRIWNVADQTEIAAFWTGRTLRSVAWSSDGHHVIAGGLDGYLETFDLLPELRDHSRVDEILRAIAPPVRHQGMPGVDRERDLFRLPLEEE